MRCEVAGSSEVWASELRLGKKVDQKRMRKKSSIDLWTSRLVARYSCGNDGVTTVHVTISFSSTWYLPTYAGT
jgi:hypothetical protein